MIDNKKLNIFIFSIRGYSILFVKNLKFLHLVFFRQNDKKKVFGDILDRKIAFLDYKNIDIRKLQNVYLSKCFDQNLEF